MPNILFHQLLLSLTFELESFEGRLNQLRAGDYPTAAANSLIAQLIKDLEEQRKRIAQIVTDLASDPKGAFDRLSSEHRKFIYRLPSLASLENAQTRRVPWSLVPSIEALASTLLPGRLVITSSNEEFNYSINWSTGSGKPPYAFLFVPAIHRLDAFLHVLVGHELFHPTLDQFLDNEQLRVSAPFRAECENYLKGQPPIPPLFEKRRLDQMVENVREIWRRALEELICDLGCAAIFGPAAILAAVSFFASANFDERPMYPEYYPPFRYRLRVMMNYPFQPDWGKPALDETLRLLASSPDVSAVVAAFQSYWQNIQLQAATKTDLAAIDRDISAKIAYAEVGPVLDRAWEYIKGLLASASIVWTRGSSASAALPWTVNYSEVPTNLRNLRMLVPCGEVKMHGEEMGRPSSICGIALAAWINHLHDHTTMIAAASQDAAEKYLRACRLFLKSLEDAELKREFAKVSAMGSKAIS